jgi:adiponectin receptor
MAGPLGAKESGGKVVSDTSASSDLPSPSPRLRRASSAAVAAPAPSSSFGLKSHRGASSSARVVHTLAEAPDWTHIPHISGGYRVDHNVTDAIASLFTSHQDTLNIWTHGLGCAWFLRMIPFVIDTLHRNGAPKRDYFLFCVFLLGATLQMATSTLYHALRCVSGEWEASLLRADIVGILAMIGGSWIIAMGQSFHCAPLIGGLYLLVEVAILATAHFLGAAAVSKPHLYPAYYLAVSSSVAFGIIPCTHALRSCSSSLCVEVLTKAYLGMFGSYTVGFAFFISRFPERIFSRVFNIVGASHSVWHVFVFLAGRSWLLGMLEFNTYKAGLGHQDLCLVK